MFNRLFIKLDQSITTAEINILNKLSKKIKYKHVKLGKENDLIKQMSYHEEDLDDSIIYISFEGKQDIVIDYLTYMFRKYPHSSYNTTLIKIKYSTNTDVHAVISRQSDEFVKSL